MPEIKKDQQRDELHRAIWAIADELRGSVDGWDFKNYVLGTMFYRYISENLTAYINENEHKAGDVGFDYARMSDADAEVAREGLIEEKGFFIAPSELFCSVCARAAQDENLNETLETVFRHIEESAKGSVSESDFEGLFDDFDVNSNKLGATVAKRNERLCKLLWGVRDMALGDGEGPRHRRLRRRLRIPDDHVRLERGQERRRVLHPRRRFRAADPSRHRRQDRDQQGVRYKNSNFDTI